MPPAPQTDRLRIEVRTAPAVHLDALREGLNGTHKSFAEYFTRLVAESGLSRKEFGVKHLGGLRDAYARKLAS